ncbi:MAG: nitrate reductase, partial [Lentisphaerae bacterium]
MPDKNSDELFCEGMSRRDFLKVAGLSGMVVSAGSIPFLMGSDKTVYLERGVEPDTWKRSVCRFCGTGCGADIGVKNGKVVAIRGTKDYPVNRGVLCLKGLSLMYVVHSPERATQPLIRENGAFRQVSMKEALDKTAMKLKETLDQYGPESIALYMGAQLFTEEIYLANKLFKGLLHCNNVEANARLCMASAVTGFKTTFGSDEPSGCYGDIEHADLFFIIGSNLAEQHPIVFGRILKRMAAKRDVKLIVADPRMTPTAAHADLWLPFLPGTDLALLNSICHVLVKEGFVDRQFVDKHTHICEGGGPWGPEKRLSWDEFTAFLAEYAPEKVAEQTGCRAEDIYTAARMFGQAPNAMSLWTMGLNQRKWGTWVNNLMYNMHFLTGKFGRPGSTALSMTGQPNACGGIREVGALAHGLPAHRTVKNSRDR